MAGWTNRGKYWGLDVALRDAAEPATFYVALVTSAVAPTADTNTLGQLTEIAVGNGYTSGGLAVERSAVGFDTLTEDDVNDLAKALLKDLSWTASGGPIPASGSGARYAVLTDDNATVANRLVLHYWNLGGDFSIPAGGTLTLQDFDVRLTEA